MTRVVIVCDGCGRRVSADSGLSTAVLRRLTGFLRADRRDWCAECGAALRAAERALDDASAAGGASSDAR